MVIKTIIGQSSALSSRNLDTHDSIYIILFLSPLLSGLQKTTFYWLILWLLVGYSLFKILKSTSNTRGCTKAIIIGVVLDIFYAHMFLFFSPVMIKWVIYWGKIGLCIVKYWKAMFFLPHIIFPLWAFYNEVYKKRQREIANEL